MKVGILKILGQQNSKLNSKIQNSGSNIMDQSHQDEMNLHTSFFTSP